MADIFREVDEEVRRERALEVLTRHGAKLVVLALLLVIGTAAWRIYDHYQGRAAEAVGARYEAALDAARAGKGEEAARAFEAIARDAPPGYRLLARLRGAAEIAKQDPEGAAKAYDAIAEDGGVPALLRDLARLRAALVLADRLSREDLQARLAPLLQAANPWRPLARELVGLALLKAGDLAGAGRTFDELATDPASPQALRQRVDIYLALVRAGPVKPAS